MCAPDHLLLLPRPFIVIMGRAGLDVALSEVPELADRLAAAEAELRRLVDILEPYAAARAVPDPDLAFQVRILQQTLQEMSWMLRPTYP